MPDPESGLLHPPLLRVAAGRSVDGPDGHFGDLTIPPRAARAEHVLHLLAGFGAARREHLETLLFAEGSMAPQSRRVAAHRVISELRERALIEPLVVPGPAARAVRGYALTAAGHRVYAATDPRYRLRRRRLSVGYVDHALAIVDVALAFRDAALAVGDVDLLWECDWEATARIGGALVIPDGVATFERDGWRTRAFVEADRSTEWHEAFRGKVRRYLTLYLSDRWRRTMRAWPLVLTVTTSDERAGTLARLAHGVVMAEGGASIAHAFRFTSYGSLHKRGPLAALWVSGASPRPLSLLEDTSPSATTAPSTRSDIVVRPDARSPERKGTEPNLENCTARVHGT